MALLCRADALASLPILWAGAAGFLAIMARVCRRIRVGRRWNGAALVAPMVAGLFAATAVTACLARARRRSELMGWFGANRPEIGRGDLEAARSI